MPPKWEKLGTTLPTTMQCGTPKTTPLSILILKMFAHVKPQQSLTIAVELTHHDTRTTVQSKCVAMMPVELLMTLFMSAARTEPLS